VFYLVFVHADKLHSCLWFPFRQKIHKGVCFLAKSKNRFKTFVHCDCVFIHCDSVLLHCDCVFMHCDCVFIHCYCVLLYCDCVFMHCDCVFIHCDCVLLHCDCVFMHCVVCLYTVIVCLYTVIVCFYTVTVYSCTVIVHFVHRTEERAMTLPARAVFSKSISDPVHLSPMKQDHTDGRASPAQPASMLNVPSGNESELRKSPSAEHKKKSAFSKLLHSSKQKTP